MDPGQDVNSGDNFADPSARALAVVDALTLAYHRLSREAERLHGEIGLNAGGRSVLMTTFREGPLTISDLARRRDVSRQFMQRVVQGLVAAGYLDEAPNPRHRRSPLMAPTAAGAAAAARIQAVEAPLWQALGAALDPRDAQGAVRVLNRIIRGLEEPA